MLKSISVLSTSYLFHFGRTVGASLWLGSRFTMNEVKVCAKALIKSVLLKGGATPFGQ